MRAALKVQAFAPTDARTGTSTGPSNGKSRTGMNDINYGLQCKYAKNKLKLDNIPKQALQQISRKIQFTDFYWFCWLIGCGTQSINPSHMKIYLISVMHTAAECRGVDRSWFPFTKTHTHFYKGSETPAVQRTAATARSVNIYTPRTHYCVAVERLFSSIWSISSSCIFSALHRASQPEITTPIPIKTLVIRIH